MQSKLSRIMCTAYLSLVKLKHGLMLQSLRLGILRGKVTFASNYVLTRKVLMLSWIL